MRVMRLQKLVKETMEKKMRKMAKKAEKAKRKAEKVARKQRRKDESTESETSSDDDKKPAKSESKASRRSPPRRRASPVRVQRSPSPSRHRARRRSRSRSPIRPQEKHSTTSYKKKSRSPSPTVVKKQEPASPPRRRRRHDSDDSDSDHKAKYAGYGLVQVKKEDGEQDVKPSVTSSAIAFKSSIPIDLPWNSRKPTELVTAPGGRFHRKERLSEAERQDRIKQMMTNATARDEEREMNLKRAALIEKEADVRDKEDKRKRGVDFLKPMVAGAQDADSLSKRIQRSRGQLQRGESAMTTHFARR